MASLGYLLDVSSPHQAVAGKQPLWVQIPVPQETIPYLVSSSRKFLWVDKSRNGEVRVGIRSNLELNDVWLEIATAVYHEGLARDWGQVAPLTTAGLEDLVTHLRLYNEDAPLVFLVGATKIQGANFPDDATIEYAEWLPPGAVVVIPQDRLLVGNLLQFGEGGFWAAIAHNASRTIGIAGVL